MNAISSNQNKPSQSVIEQYKSYFKSLNLQQYGSGVLLNALNDPQNSDGLFQNGQTQNSGIMDIFSGQAAASVNINTDAVQKKLWMDLENEIKSYESKHPETKGKYIVAINPGSAGGVPSIKVADKNSVLGLINQDAQKESDALITDHPVQVFDAANVDVNKLKDAGVQGIQDVVSAFLAKNQSVFQFLSNQQSAASTLPSLMQNQGTILGNYLA